MLNSQADFESEPKLQVGDSAEAQAGNAAVTAVPVVGRSSSS